MKKIVALFLAMMMVLSLAACGGGNDTPDPSGSGDNTPSNSEQQEQPGSTPDEGDNSDNTPASDEWPDNEWTSVICKPTTGRIALQQYVDEYSRYEIRIGEWSLEEAEAYVKELYEMGFVSKASGKEPKLEQLIGRNSYEETMKNNNGYKVAVNFNPDNNWGFIHISLED